MVISIVIWVYSAYVGWLILFFREIRFLVFGYVIKFFALELNFLLAGGCCFGWRRFFGVELYGLLVFVATISKFASTFLGLVEDISLLPANFPGFAGTSPTTTRLFLTLPNGDKSI